MNLKTTIVLIVLLAGVGGYIFFTRDKESDQTPKKIQEHKLVDVKKEDVSKIVLSNSEGKQTVLEKSGANWRLTQPVNASADPFEVGGLLDGILGLTSTAEVDASGANAPKTGLDKPQITVELTAGGKQTKVLIGDKLAVSNSMYVRVQGQDKAQVVPADLLEKLDRPAADLRQMKLVEASSNDIQQVTVTRKGETISLQKKGTAWEMLQPSKVAVDPTAITDLLAAITGLRATSFVEEASEASGLDAPRMTVFYSTAPAATQPSTKPTTAQAGVTLAFGGYDDVLKKNVYVKLSDPPGVAKVPATVLESLSKKPLDLRDKTVVKLTPAEVSRFSILTDAPASTQPTSKPAKKSDVQVERRKAFTRGGPPFVPAPTVQPTTGPAASRPAILELFKPEWPGPRPSPWVFATDTKGDADISDVNAFLDLLNPLRAEKLIEKSASPTTQPASTYTIRATTVVAGGETVEHEIRLIDRGGDQPLLGEYNGLNFEIARTVLPNLEKDFKSKPGSANTRPDLNAP